MLAPKIAKAQTKASDSPTHKLARQSSTLAARPLGGGAVEQARMLQGTIGNQAMLRCLTQRLSNLPAKGRAELHEQEAAPENMTVREAPRGPSWDFSKIPVFPPDRVDRPQPPSLLAATPLPGAIQAKLVVGQANDPLEHEAERVADRVMRIPDPPPSTSRTTLHISRKFASKQSAAPPIVHEVMGSPSQPLDPATRDFMEPRFGYDFSRVRVHSGTFAEQSTRDVNAKAYTVGHDIVFGAGQYMPGTRHGAQLLAHELAHVVQQQGIAQFPVRIQRYEGPEHQDLGDKHADELLEFIQTEEGQKWASGRNIDAVKLADQMADDPMRRSKKIKVRADLALTPGQIISLMGDFYATWQALKAAPKSEIDQILAVMDKERLGTAKNADAEYETITKRRYTRLAGKNAPHFAPKNKEAWKALHVQAIEMAKLSKQEKVPSNNDMYQEALGMDAAGGHFLTDAFASGHLMDSTKVQVEIQNYLLTNPIRTENPEMQTVVVGVQTAGLAIPLTLKNIHDRMNAEGFEVTNAQGMKWRTYGDNHLKNAVETRRVAAYAVFISRQQINQARNGESPDPNEVLALLPDATSVDRATKQAVAYIPQAVREISPLINRGKGMLDTVRPPLYLGGPVLPFLGKSVLGAISDPGRPKVLEDYERRKQNDPTAPYPTVFGFRWDF